MVVQVDAADGLGSDDFKARPRLTSSAGQGCQRRTLQGWVEI